MTISLSYNNQLINCSADITVQALLAEQANQKQGFAVAVNGHFVPRGNYSSHCLQDGDVIDVVSAVTGG